MYKELQVVQCPINRGHSHVTRTDATKASTLCDRTGDVNGGITVAGLVELAVLENDLTLTENGGGVGVLDMLRKLQG